MAHGGGRLLHVIQVGLPARVPGGGAHPHPDPHGDGERSLAVVEIDLVAGD